MNLVGVHASYSHLARPGYIYIFAPDPQLCGPPYPLVPVGIASSITSLSSLRTMPLLSVERHAEEGNEHLGSSCIVVIYNTHIGPTQRLYLYRLM